MNKRETIIAEAKRLFGTYGYLGFTLKQLARACHMTAPALYYFYSSKAELFKDCLLSEMQLRQGSLERCAAPSASLQEFCRRLVTEAIEVCDLHSFRTGQAMQEIIHLPAEMQQELRNAWERHLIDPGIAFLTRVLPEPPPTAPSRHMLATFLINMATFASCQHANYSTEDLTNLFLAAARGFEGACTGGQPAES